MNKMIALFSLALALPAGAVQAPAGTPVPSSAQSVLAQAVAANAKLTALVDGAKGALPDTKDMIHRADEAGRVIAAAQKALDDIRAGINVPRPDASGKAEKMMDALQDAEDAMIAGTPDGHSLAEGYYVTLARVREYDPYGDAALANAAMEIAVANMQRAFVELRKQAYDLGYELRYRLSDTELGDRDLRAFGYDANMSAFSGTFESTKRDLEQEEKGAPADYQKKLDGLKDLAVFGSPRSA